MSLCVESWAARAKKVADKATAPKVQGAAVTAASNTSATAPTGGAPETEQQAAHQRPGSKQQRKAAAVKDKDLIANRNDEVTGNQSPKASSIGSNVQAVKVGPNNKPQQQRPPDSQQRSQKRDDDSGRQSALGNNKSQQRQRDRFPKQQQTARPSSSNEQQTSPIVQATALSVVVPGSPTTPSASPDRKWSDVVLLGKSADADASLATSLAPSAISPRFATPVVVGGVPAAPACVSGAPSPPSVDATQVAMPATPQFVSLPPHPQSSHPQLSHPQLIQPVSAMNAAPMIAAVLPAPAPLQPVASESPAVRRKIGNAPLPTRPLLSAVGAASPQKAAKASVSFGSIGILENETDENEPSHHIPQNDVKPTAESSAAVLVSKSDASSSPVAIIEDKVKEDSPQWPRASSSEEAKEQREVEASRAVKEFKLETAKQEFSEKPEALLEESPKVAVDVSRNGERFELPVESYANRNEVDVAEDLRDTETTSVARRQSPCVRRISIPVGKVYPTVFLVQIRNAWFCDGLFETTEEQRDSCPLPKLCQPSGMRIPDDIRRKDIPSLGDRNRRSMGPKLGGSPMTIRSGGFGPIRNPIQTPSSMRNSVTSRHRGGDRSLSGDEGEEAWREPRFSASPQDNSRARMAKAITDPHELVERKLKSILNKLTVEKFAPLYEQIKQAGMQGENDVTMLMEMICAKARVQHHFIPMYVDLCTKLQQDLASMICGEADFRRLLVDACQQSFNQCLQPIQIPDTLVSEEDRFEYEQMEKKKIKGNTIFVGELYKKKMVAGKVVLGCVDILLTNKGEPQLEALCVLLLSSGKTLAESKFKGMLNEKLVKIKSLIQTDTTLSTRLKCLLQVRETQFPVFAVFLVKNVSFVMVFCDSLGRNG